MFCVSNGVSVFSDAFAISLITDDVDGALSRFTSARALGELRDGQGNGLLHLCVRYGNCHALRHLAAERGCPLEARNHLGNTPLLEAAAKGDCDAAKLLLELGADVRARNLAGQGPLHFCHRYRDAGLLELVVGAARAAGADAPELARLLLEAGGPLHNAVRTRDPRVVRLVCRKPEQLDRSDPEGYTALHAALGLLDRRMVECLIELGLDLRRGSPDGLGMLVPASRWAFRLGDHERFAALLRFLLSRGAELRDICSFYWQDKTILHQAAQDGNLRLLGELHERGADFAVRTEIDARGLVHFAAEKPRPRLLRFLLDTAKLRLDDRDANLRTPLHVALTHLRTDSYAGVKFLLEHGASANAADKHGNTPLSILLRHGCDELALAERERLASLLLEHGADVNHVDPAGGSVLIHALGKGLEWLLLRHVAVLQASGRELGAASVGLIRSRPALEQYLHRCRAELLRMRDGQIFEGLGFLELLSPGPGAAAAQLLHVETRQLAQAFRASGYAVRFPIYAAALQDRFNKLMREHTALRRSLESAGATPLSRVLRLARTCFARLNLDLSELLLLVFLCASLLYCTLFFPTTHHLPYVNVKL